jgi:hypothetical protein
MGYAQQHFHLCGVQYGCLDSVTFNPWFIFRLGHEHVIAFNLMDFARYSRSYKEPASPNGCALFCLLKGLLFLLNSFKYKALSKLDLILAIDSIS